jgi:PAS domain S-box-containing protein
MNSRMTLRRSILLTLSPLVILLTVVGGAGVLFLHRLGGRIDVIFRENYESVVAMQNLKEALERIDSSFQFMLVARGLKDRDERRRLEEKARVAYETNWQRYDAALKEEQNNITIHPTEDDLVERLVTLTARYRNQGSDFYNHASENGAQHHEYYSEGGLYDVFCQIKQVADEILQLNQKEMKIASANASQTATNSMIWLSGGLLIAVLLAGLSAWHTIRTTLWPIRAVTQSALGISAGNLDQVVPALSRDELGQLAEAFNLMARHLRDYRQSQSAQLLRAQQTSQATIDSFPDPVIVVDSEGQVEMANPAARRLLGVIPRREGLHSAAWHPPSPLSDPLTQALRGVQDYLPEGFDKTILLGSNGRERAVLPRIVTIRDPYGRTLGAAVVLQDVTRLRLLDQVKSNLLATASHELKTPLTSIRLIVHLLLEETTGPLTPKQMELLLDARENCERLLDMVNNLLDLARLEQGWRQLDVRPESPESLLRSAAETSRPRAEDKGVDITLDIPTGLPPVAADASRIGHALCNLLDNALTYTDAGGRITLSAAPGPDAVQLTIADTGIGIPPEYLPHVFEKFFRVPGQSRGTGTGLGLAIVREIVTAHGGTITCESHPGVGTSFHLTLPIATDNLDTGYVYGHSGDSQTPLVDEGRHAE